MKPPKRSPSVAGGVDRSVGDYNAFLASWHGTLCSDSTYLDVSERCTGQVQVKFPTTFADRSRLDLFTDHRTLPVPRGTVPEPSPDLARGDSGTRFVVPASSSPCSNQLSNLCRAPSPLVRSHMPDAPYSWDYLEQLLIPAQLVRQASAGSICWSCCHCYC